MLASTCLLVSATIGIDNRSFSHSRLERRFVVGEVTEQKCMRSRNGAALGVSRTRSRSSSGLYSVPVPA